jgi:hypothetical protein
MRFGMWNVGSLCRAGSLKTVARELGKYKLYLVGIQEVSGEKGCTERAEDCTFFYGEGNGDHQLGTGFFIHKKISVVWRVEFVSDRMTYIILRSRWFNIIVLDVHDLCEDKCDDVKDSFYEELRHVFDQFPRYEMKILLGDFNAKVGRECIFKLTIQNENSLEISNDNGIRVVNLATSKNLVFKSTMFPHRCIHKYTWTSPDGKTHNQIDHILIEDGIQVYLMSDLSEGLIVILTTVR